MDPNSDLHDYSTSYGKIQLFFNKFNWKWSIFTILAVTVVALPFVFAGINAAGTVPKPTGILKATNQAEFLFNGPENTLTTFTGYDEIISRNQEDPLKPLTALTIRNAYVDAPTLSQSLQGLVNVESITLDNVWLIGNFTRVFLPKLSKFSYQQNGMDKRDSYKSPSTLKTTLFFDKIQNGSWDVEQDLLNLGVVIQISKAGTKLIEVNQSAGEVYLNIKYCQDVLKNIAWSSILNLSLITCNVTEEIEPFIPNTLKYLNMRNSIPSTMVLERFIKPQTQLLEFYGWFNFHCDWPGYEVYLNISDLPLSTRKVGVNNMDLSCNSGFKSSITDFSVGDFINPQIVKDFDKIFPNIKRVGVFNISTQYAYPLLRNILKTKAESIALVMFERINASSFDFMAGVNMVDVKQTVFEVENLLSDLGIGSSESDFIIETKGKLKSGRALLETEKHSLRYTGLGFNKMDTLNDYLLWDSLKLPNISGKISTTNAAILISCILFSLCSFVCSCF